MKILIKLLTVFAILCTVACSQTFEDVSNNNLSSNSDTKAKGLLAMNVGEMSRTITNTLTNADIHSAVLTANNETVGNWSGEDVIGQIESDKSISLDIGNYDFVLSVKNEAGKTLATAQTSKYIEVGTNHISLSLKSVATGEGSFEVTFSWQSDYVSSIKAGLYDCETDEEITGCEMAALTVTDKTAVYAKDDLPVGQYILMLNFYDDSDGLLKTYTEVLRVEAYRKTTATRQFAGFNTEHTIEYELTESWKSDFTPVTERNAAEEVELPTIENIDTEKDVTSYILKWYTTETFETGTEIKKIEAGTDKDMKLYGKIETCYRTTADGFLKTIQSLTVGGPHNVIVTGELTSSQLSTIATYIKNYSTRKINLDLSETTGLTTINSYTFENCTGLVNIVIPDSVTGINWEAFENCSSLTGITIPNSVTRIYSERSFIGCSSLTAFNVSANNNYYSSSDDGKILYNKDKTTLLAYPSATGDVTIPDSVTSIGEYAFYNCDSLTSVTIPDSVTSIDSSAFWDCSNLTSVHITDLTAWMNIKFENASSNPLYNGADLYLNGSLVTDLVIPAGMTSIGYYAFEYCSNLTSVTIGNSVTSIGGGAFYGCSSLESVYITDLTAWMNIKFENASSNPLYNGADLYLNGSLVTDLVIPAGMTSIGKYAFYNCDSLESVTIPDSVTYIGEGAFSGCDNLEITINTDDKYLYSEDGTTILLCDSSVTSVKIPENVASINSGAFACCRNVETIETGDTLMSLSGLPITSVLKSITIGNGVTFIDSYAFENCSSLASVTIGNSVMSIGSDAFSGCSSLASVTIPDSVTSIGYDAFENCSSLESVTIGNSVTSIGSSAFYNCSSLASVTIGNSVTSIGSSAFYNCSSLVSAYITDLTAWKNIEFYNSYSNPLYYGANLYLNGNLAEFTVTFDAVGGSLSGEAVQTVKSGECVVEPTAPSKNGYVFCGWYTSTDAGQTLSSTAYNFDTAVKEDITLYAKWEDKDGYLRINFTGTTPPVAAWIWDDFYGSGRIPLTGKIGGFFVFDIKLIENPTKVSFIILGDGDEWNKLSGDADITFKFPQKYKEIWVDTNGKIWIDAAQTKEPAGLLSASITGKYEIAMVTTGIDSVAATDFTVTDKNGNPINIINATTTKLTIDNTDYINKAPYTITYNSEDTVVASYTSDIFLNDESFFNGKDLIIPDSVTSIGSSAFYGCDSLESVTIPDSVTSIDGSAFEYCSNLTSVHITDLTAWMNIEFYNSYSNPLYNGAKLYLNGSLVTDLVIPDGMTSIGKYAFDGCSSLESVTIGNGVASIGWGAFNGCSNLTTVNYKGTQEQWEEISIGYSNSYLTNATINYNYTGE